MAIVRRSPHRRWVPLLTIVASMLASADASGREICGIGACAVQACLGPWADPFSMPDTADSCPVVRRQGGVHDTVPSHVEADHRAVGASSRDRSTMRPSRSSHLRFDAEAWNDRADGDDDTDVPVRAWFRDMVRGTDVIPAGGGSRSSEIDPPSVSSASYQRLRC
jgi:hypothetical protein